MMRGRAVARWHRRTRSAFGPALAGPRCLRVLAPVAFRVLAPVALCALLPVALRAQRPPIGVAEARDIVSRLAETYGVSGHEGPVRDAVVRLLPAWAKPTIDSAGNILVRAGAGAPRTVYVAHLDEIGFAVTAIRENGQLELRRLGGFFPSLFEAEPALVHTASGIVPAVFMPRDSVGRTPGRDPGALRVDAGTGSRAATEALGIRVGDAVTMPKAFTALAETRATARSFDDRVGSTAQLLAVRHLDPRRLAHAVLFVWSTGEEVGLDGARFVAEHMAPGERPARVYAIDTFVSSDAPLETRTFADVPLGAGAVVRAVDNSSVTPPALVDTLLNLARAAHIPAVVGTTNGGNDGSTFTRFGVADVGIGWPQRYSHSPVELMDVRDLVALADLIQLTAERW
jgi:putative aminopeptidase FrvX